MAEQTYKQTSYVFEGEVVAPATTRKEIEVSRSELAQLFALANKLEVSLCFGPIKYVVNN